MALEPVQGDFPLPPAPLAHDNAQPASQGRELLALLATMARDIGYPSAIRMLPGGFPASDVPAAALVATSRYLHDQLGFHLLSSIAGLDMLDYRQVVYHLNNLEHRWLLEMKVRVPESNEIDSVIGVWSGADPLERETYDLFGIVFAGHPDLRRILLDDEFEGFPLLKSFRQTPLAVHDHATTQVPPEQAIVGAEQRGVGAQRITPSHLSQVAIEHLHPGVSTFGDDQFHGHEFPPITWKHRPEYRGTGDNMYNGEEAPTPNTENK